MHIMLQVLETYISYAESVIGRFGTKSDGGPVPTMRSTVKPLLALFHGEKGCKAWKRSLDGSMNAGGSVSAAIRVSSLSKSRLANDDLRLVRTGCKSVVQLSHRRSLCMPDLLSLNSHRDVSGTELLNYGMLGCCRVQ